MQYNFYRISVATILLILCATHVSGFTPPQTTATTLSNAKCVARFDDTGLVAIGDVQLNQELIFSEDGWSLGIDGLSIESRKLTPKNVVAEKHSISYHYAYGRFAIEVVYELQPDWHFVSKQIFVRDVPGSEFQVDRVAVFTGRISTKIDDVHVIQTGKKQLRKEGRVLDFGAFLRFKESWGAFILVQNPFLQWENNASLFSLSYEPRMSWKSEYGRFASDRGCIGTYKLTGHRTPAYLESHPEWNLKPAYQTGHDPDGMDVAEVDAYIDCVRAFLQYDPDRSVRVHVPWCENDYQIDVAQSRDEAEWKRIIDRSAELGIGHVFYTCANSTLALRKESADAWNWEYLLWLNMGPKIRRGEWDPKSDPLPKKTRELIDYAASKNVKLMAYVYPSLPFEQDGTWLTPKHSSKPENLAANLGYRKFQDWLIEKLLVFKERTGVSGYSFDYTSLTMPGQSYYAQWYGWRRVLETLRKEAPDIVIDGRQSYHKTGPWGWLAGSYPHPTAGDEQPESFHPFPDLHFDRSSATHQRFTAYWFRNTQFCPVEIMPGFVTHQTARKDGTGELRLDHFNVRDWDYLGWKFSLFSSIATAPFAHCVDMIPARDEAEFEHFPEEDKEFINRWFDWTDENASILKNMRTIIGPPAVGHIDGTAAIEGDRGFLFLFNPNHRQLTAEFTLDEAIGLREEGQFVLRQLYPNEGELIGSPESGAFRQGDRVKLPMDGTTSLVLELVPLPSKLSEPMLLGVRGDGSLSNGILSLKNVQGEVGREFVINVLTPTDDRISGVTVNGHDATFGQRDNVVTLRVRFDGDRFDHAQQVGQSDPVSTESNVRLSFKVPQRIFRQLDERKKRWPIPWTDSDYDCTWLAPERLLLYVQIAEPLWTMDVTMKIDGNPVVVKKAYSSITPGRLQQDRGHNTFLGFYADVSDLKPDQEHQVELTLPELEPGQFQGLFFSNVETEYTNVISTSTQENNVVTHTIDPLLQEKTTCLNPNYYVSMPEGHKGEKVPLMIYLHGGGSKGVKMNKIDHCIPRLRFGIDKFNKDPCIVVVPQCLAKTEDGTRGRWKPEDLNILLENLMNTLPVDPDRVYLTGNSMGGSGSWAWGGSNPEHFAAIAPISGGVGSRDSEEVSPKIAAMAKNLATVPVYAFAGEKDDVVSPENSKRMIAAIQKAGGTKAKLKVYPDAGHGAKGIAYKSQEFYDWMFSQTRK